MSNELLLIVEDNDILREGLVEILTIEGYKVASARHGAEALEKLNSFVPDLIISDILMPVMDGYAFYRQLRTNKNWLAIPFIFLTARAERIDILTGKDLGADDYLIKPVNRDELVSVVQSRLGRSRQIQVAQLRQAYLASLTALVNAIELRDPLKTRHVERVTAYSLAIAEQLNWNSWNKERLRFGAILHDIGKIHISEQVLFKLTPLNDEEWALIRRHPVLGAEMIKDVPYLVDIIPFVRHHHEAWNGSGYPDGLAGESIPDGARILAVADAFDAITSPRRFAASAPLESAVEELRRYSGVRYDPSVIAAFMQLWAVGQIQTIAANR
jgi:putative two-component system response regulator